MTTHVNSRKFWRTAILFVSMALAVFTLSACSAKTDTNTPAASVDAAADTAAASTPPAVVEIKEKMFIAQTNDIYANKNDYLGKTIKYEGIFDQSSAFIGGESVTYSMVIRYGPGCCGIDQNAGFEVVWNDPDKQYPAPNDWVEATGVLEEYAEEGESYLRLRLSSLNVLEKRGAETVLQ